MSDYIIIVYLGSSVIECSHSKQETLGSSPGQAMLFFCPCDISMETSHLCAKIQNFMILTHHQAMSSKFSQSSPISDHFWWNMAITLFSL